MQSLPISSMKASSSEIMNPAWHVYKCHSETKKIRMLCHMGSAMEKNVTESSLEMYCTIVIQVSARAVLVILLIIFTRVIPAKKM